MASESLTLSARKFGFDIDREITIWLVRSPTETDLITLPNPSGGYGGHELILSDDERFAAVWFSEDGNWLVMLVRSYGYEFFDGRLDWATFYVQQVPDGKIRTVEVVIETATPPDRDLIPTNGPRTAASRTSRVATASSRLRSRRLGTRRWSSTSRAATTTS
jgi:hypothetical protein